MTRKFAYYNENDPKAAAWLRELIKGKVITDGEVDERSIEDVLPADLAGFGRCHFFAGVGVWDYALGLAEWDRSGTVWTGSCPCQPFSQAGKGAGFADERHLFPAWFHLIEVCRPDVLFGEQVASKDGLAWLDLVLSDLEGISYTTGAIDLPAAGVGAPHIRQRIFFVGYSDSSGSQNGRSQSGGENRHGRNENDRPKAEKYSSFGELGNTSKRRLVGRKNSAEFCESPNAADVEATGETCPLEHAASKNTGSERKQRSGKHGQRAKDGRAGEGLVDTDLSAQKRLGQHGGEILSEQKTARFDERGFTNGFWRDVEWIFCRDEKYRPVKPGIFPLADRTPGRVALLRGAGNAIVAEAAAEFIKASVDVLDL